MTENDKPHTVSAFEHENALWHYGNVNRRSMVMLIAVCITFILITLVFVIGYTVREKNWLNTLSQITTSSEVSGGVQQQPSN